MAKPTISLADVRRCSECGREWEAAMGSPFVCPGCGFTSTLFGTHPLPTGHRFLADRFPNHPEAIEGDVSDAFLDLIGRVHPDQDYPSEVAALLCRYAYDLGRAELTNLTALNRKWDADIRESTRRGMIIGWIVGAFLCAAVGLVGSMWANGCSIL